jgi:hypothetical protein
MRILQFYYPGWQAHVAGSEAELDLRPTEPDGLLSIDVPAGDHKIVIELTKTDAERTAQLISAISAVCLILYAALVGGMSLRRKRIAV